MGLTKSAILVKVAAIVAALALTPGAAQAADADTHIWYHPGDQFMPSMIWSFDHATSTGWKRSYAPSLTGWPVQRQTTFTFEKSGSVYNLTTFAYGGSQRITGVGYSPATDIWNVDNNGYAETWYGCDATGLPAYVIAAC